MSSLTYGLETCPIRASDNNSLDFVVNRFFVKLFKINNRYTVSYCRMQFNFELPSALAQKQVNKNFVAKYRSHDNFCKYV